jgi:hypothetical protein
MRVRHSCLLAVALLALAAAPASAGYVVYFGTLSGAAQVPPNASPGYGYVTVTYNHNGGMFVYSVEFYDLAGPTTYANVHCCTSGSGGDAWIATSLPTLQNFPAGQTTGTYTLIAYASSSSTYNPNFVWAVGGTTTLAQAALKDGMGRGSAYFNLRSAAFPNGELRAYLSELPIFVAGFD